MKTSLKLSSTLTLLHWMSQFTSNCPVGDIASLKLKPKVSFINKSTQSFLFFCCNLENTRHNVSQQWRRKGSEMVMEMWNPGLPKLLQVSGPHKRESKEFWGEGGQSREDHRSSPPGQVTGQRHQQRLNLKRFDLRCKSYQHSDKMDAWILLFSC